MCFFNRRKESKFDRILSDLQEIKTIMSTIQPGLAALQAADSNLADAVTKGNAEISALAAQLANNEDPAVQAIAADIQAKADSINAAVAAATPAQTPPAADV